MSGAELYVDFRNTEPTVARCGDNGLTVKFFPGGVSLDLTLDHYTARSLMWSLQDMLREVGAA